MSNYLAVATVTEALRQMLEAAISADIAAARATAVRPTTPGSAAGGLPNPGVNIFLYQVSPNAAWRNMDLPTRRDDASLVNRPRVALDLNYILTFYGQDTQLEPQRLLGRAVQALHAQPVLTRQQIRNTVTATSFLAASNLADEVELVKFTPLPLSLEELSKLWSIFFQTAYVLSVAYQGTVVLIEGEESPRRPLPVSERRLHVLPYQRPLIYEVSPQILEQGATLTIRGQGLKADSVKIGFGRVTSMPAEITNERVEVVLPAGLPAGVNTAQVRQFMDFETGTASEPHLLFESNVAAFVLAPKIREPEGPEPVFGKVARGFDLNLEVLPPIGRTQDVRLLLGDRTISLPPRPASDPPTTTGLKFRIPADFPTGEFLVRLQVDGAQSILKTEATQGYIGPKVAIICVSNCLRCTNITLSQTAAGMEGFVTVQDETPAPVKDAEVSATWTLPDGTAQNDSQNTDNLGIAKFVLLGGNGRYILTINKIAKKDFVFDQLASEMSRSLIK
jgi:hypothetical protein